MKNFWRLAGPLFIVLVCGVATTWAETRYISDQLVVSLREQPQNSAKSITYLRTDTPVEILDETGEFIKVQTEAGEIGYVKSNYLTKNTPKTVIIERLQQERDRLAGKAGKMEKQVATATSRSDQAQQELSAQLTETRKQATSLEEELKKSQSDLAQVKREYQSLQKDSKNVVAITKERDRLRQETQELTAAVAKLEKEQDQLMTTAVIKWFFAGAGVLFLGWIIGKMSGSNRRRSLL